MKPYFRKSPSVQARTEGGARWGRGYGMSVMWVAYEDDLSKNQGLRVPRHGALGRVGLEWGKTFVSYCISSMCVYIIL